MSTVVLGVELRDWPRIVWTRLTYCTRHGHLYKLGDVLNGIDTCANCGAPWRKIP